MARLTRVLLTLLAVIMAPCFFIGGPDWVSLDIVRQLWNFGHIAFFALCTVLIHQYVSLAHWSRWLFLSLVVLIIGIIIEQVQGIIGRHKSWQDVFYNLTGVWLGLFWFLKPSPGVWMGRIWALVAFMPAFLAVLMSAYGYWSLQQQMPVINSFETGMEIQQLHFNPERVQVMQMKNHATQGLFSLAVTLNPARYSGVRVAVPVSDWSPYQQLQMDFFNPEPELLIVMLRISDRQHDRGENRFDDRFNQLITLKPGWNHIAIPLSRIRTAPKARAMNLDEVSSIGLFASNLPAPREFFWDYLFLK